jgi:uracil-DNA glycosylase
MIVKGDGPIPARIMIVGEAPGADEEREGVPFVGVAGRELNRMLHEAGITRSECFVTNVARVRPLGNDIGQFIALRKKDITPRHKQFRDKWVTPEITEGFEHLQVEIGQVKPNIIIALGNTPMWALTGKWGITKWRGSMLRTDNGLKVIPTIHPASVLREWSQRAAVVHDLRRAARYANGTDYPDPGWNFTVSPTFTQVTLILTRLLSRADHEPCPLRLSVDIETRSWNIACIGIAWSTRDALCIPLMCYERPAGYWDALEEAEIIYRLYWLLTHRNVEVIGQNLLYDTQYIYRYWHFIPRVHLDTMIAQHSCFSDLPKSLAFICSLFCQHYVYWKDEGKNI